VEGMMRIILVRHGRVRLKWRNWISPNQMAEWIHAFNTADVCIDDIPDETQAVAESVEIFVSSTMTRSIRSAQCLCGRKAVVSNAVFVEAGLPYASWRTPELPAAFWALVFRLAWLLGYARESESYTQAKQRSVAASRQLINLAQQHGSVLLVGHGIMNRLIAKQLAQMAWRPEGRQRVAHWRCSVYVPNREHAK
jgi:broad specificity phosphatase PhoE